MNKDRNERTEEQAQFLESGEAFQNYLRQQARRALVEVFEQEVNALCGGRYGRDNEGGCYRPEARHPS